VAYALGFLLPAAPVLIRSWTLTGYAMGPPRPPATVPVTTSARHALEALAGRYASELHGGVQMFALGAAAAALVAWLAWRGRGGLAEARAVLLARQRFVLPLWTVGYLVFVVGGAAQFSLPLLDTRLLVPASVSLALLGAAVLARAWGPGLRAAWAGALAVVIVKSLVLAHALASSPPANPRRRIRESQRLQWVARQTTAQDLLVGDDAHDLGFDRRRKVVSFDYYNHSARFHPLTGAGLCVLLSWARCEEHRNVYLILRESVARRERWMREPFLADLMHGRFDRYPHVEPLGRLDDAYVYRWRCGPCGGPGRNP
jgi:hypothetical protein